MDKRLNIVFIPSEKAATEAIKLCKEIENKYKVSFSLDGVFNHPHITIYQLIIPEDNLEGLIQAVQNIAHLNRSQKFVFKNFQVHLGFLGVSFNLTTEIKELQQIIVKKTASLRGRQNIIEPDNPIIEQYPQDQQQLIKKLGFDNLFDFYNPHITITRLPEFKIAAKLASELSWQVGSFWSESIAVYELGDYGTCNKLIQRFNLKAAN